MLFLAHLNDVLNLSNRLAGRVSENTASWAFKVDLVSKSIVWCKYPNTSNPPPFLPGKMHRSVRDSVSACSAV